ncbi:MAG TPA: DUF2627 domain-containing protein [Bacillales bacterium]
MRVIAWLILILPGIVAGIGIKWMRDAFFDQQYFPYLWMQFIAGLFAFALGMFFIGGFIFYRERKKHNSGR